MKAILTTAALALGTTVAAAPAANGDPAAGARLYAANCSACHGADRAGIPGTFPALIDVGKRLDSGQIREKIRKGGGLMPPFTQLSQQDVDDIASFLER